LRSTEKQFSMAQALVFEVLRAKLLACPQVDRVASSINLMPNF
jgi:hypothetical protein